MHHHPLNASSPDSPSAPSSQSSALQSKTPSRPDPSHSSHISTLHMRAVRFSWVWRSWRIRGGGERGSGGSKRRSVSSFDDRLIGGEMQGVADVVVGGGGGLTPGSLVPQSPHFGGLPLFFVCWYWSFPPGVLTMRTLLERVLYLIVMRQSSVFNASDVECKPVHGDSRISPSLSIESVSFGLCWRR